MQDEGKDEYDIRKQVSAGRFPHRGGDACTAPAVWGAQNEVLAETDMMIPDTRKRLTTAVDALQDFIVSGSAGAACVAVPTRTSPQDANEEALAAAAGLPAARELISAFSEPEAAGAAAGGEEDI